MQLLRLSGTPRLQKVKIPLRKLGNSFGWAHSIWENVRRLSGIEYKLRWSGHKMPTSNLGRGERLTLAGSSSRWLP